MLQLTYELRPKWKKKKKNKKKSQNAVSRSDPLQGSDNENQYILESHLEWALCVRVQLARAEAILADVWPL